MTKRLVAVAMLAVLAACGVAGAPAVEGGRTGVTLGGEAYFGVQGRL